jgi:NADPH:quinone reductase-like Zn-dependent oxidoreductase
MTEFPTLLSKAWVYYEQGPLTQTLQQTNIPIDTQLGPNEVIVEIKAAALNPVDIQVGNIPQWIANWILFTGINKAKIPSADFSGVIHKIGTNVTKYKIGDEVFGLNLSLTGNGCLSQYIKLSETMPSMTHKPTNLSHIEAAAVPLVFLTGYTALHDWGGFIDNNTNDQKVLILGASGGVGHIACQIARTMNKYIVGTCSTQNIEFVKKMGANEVIDYTKNDVLTASKQYGPYDVILDCVGGTELLPYLNSGLLKSNQSVYLTIVGDKTSRGVIGGTASYLFTPSMILRSFKSLIGLGPRYYCINLSPTEENTNQMFYMLNKGTIKPMIDSVFGFDNVKQAYERLDSSRVKGKVVIDFNK